MPRSVTPGLPVPAAPPGGDGRAVHRPRAALRRRPTGPGLYGLLPDDLPIGDERVEAGEAGCARRWRSSAGRCASRRFPAGTQVGYGGRWTAERESVIATLPVGYGDGFVRAYSPGAEALVRGVRVPLVGTVAMDAVMADVTDVPGVEFGR